jgi:hypothetical protein
VLSRFSVHDLLVKLYHRDWVFTLYSSVYTKERGNGPNCSSFGLSGNVLLFPRACRDAGRVNRTDGWVGGCDTSNVPSRYSRLPSSPLLAKECMASALLNLPSLLYLLYSVYVRTFINVLSLDVRVQRTVLLIKSVASLKLFPMSVRLYGS